MNVQTNVDIPLPIYFEHGLSFTIFSVLHTEQSDLDNVSEEQHTLDYDSYKEYLMRATGYFAKLGYEVCGDFRDVRAYEDTLWKGSYDADDSDYDTSRHEITDDTDNQ